MTMGIIRVCTSLIRSLWTLLNIACGLCTLLAGYGGYINPDKFVLAQLSNMTFPGWIVLTLILLAVNLFIRKKLAWLSVAVLVACIGPILTISPLNFTSRSLSPDDESRTFTLLTYNVYNFRDNQGVNPEWGNRTLSYILSTDADIVCLQESSNLNGVGKKAQRDSINSRYPYRLYSNRSGEVLLSKYHATEIDTPQPDWGSGSFCAYDVEVEGHEVTVVNCHLQSIGLTDDDKELYRELTDKELRNPSRSELSKVKNGIVTKLLAAFRIRAQQARYIKEFLATRKGNVILVGGFNDVRLSHNQERRPEGRLLGVRIRPHGDLQRQPLLLPHRPDALSGRLGSRKDKARRPAKLRPLSAVRNITLGHGGSRHYKTIKQFIIFIYSYESLSFNPCHSPHNDGRGN